MTEPTQADKEAWEALGPAIFHCDITGPEAVAQIRIQARREALEEAARVAEEWFPSGTENRYPSFGVVAAIRNLARFPTDK